MSALVTRRLDEWLSVVLGLARMTNKRQNPAYRPSDIFILAQARKRATLLFLAQARKRATLLF